mmetsp:Transcript_19467/g.31800  ORF Transcript_19467/g.31800 Transcript_19467/m.31800 type:complete len:221 (-) Transcript_19467:721-1383(-)
MPNFLLFWRSALSCFCLFERSGAISIVLSASAAPSVEEVSECSSLPSSPLLMSESSIALRKLSSSPSLPLLLRLVLPPPPPTPLLQYFTFLRFFLKFFRLSILFLLLSSWSSLTLETTFLTDVKPPDLFSNASLPDDNPTLPLLYVETVVAWPSVASLSGSPSPSSAAAEAKTLALTTSTLSSTSFFTTKSGRLLQVLVPATNSFLISLNRTWVFSTTSS